MNRSELRSGAGVTIAAVLLTVLGIAQLAPGLVRAASPTGDAFTRNEVVPDLLPNAPDETLQVTYGAGLEVTLGNELTPTQVSSRPKLCWKTDTTDTLYTLVMADPDAPSRSNPEMRSWKHWLVGNIPGQDVDAGEVLADYVGAGPPQGTGLHRYVLLVYRQPSGQLTFNETRLSSQNPNRGKWPAAEFAEMYGLGTPIAGNFFQAQYDDYVPELYATFTDT